MNVIHAFILGIVEGLTEFLPVSSTAHLILASKLMHLPQTEFQTFFEIFIQSGAILAIVFLYFEYVLKHKDLWAKFVVSFIPTAVVGLILEKIIKKFFFNSTPLILGSMFVIGVIFIVFEYFIKKDRIKISKSIKDMTYKEAFFIGVGQSLAVIPGVSRSGIVMLTMMGINFRRDESAVYSFLLGVPTILAASGFEVLKTNFGILTDPNNLLLLAVGFVMSFITAVLSVKWFVGFLKKNTLVPFGIYRIILSVFFFVV